MVASRRTAWFGLSLAVATMAAWVGGCGNVVTFSGADLSGTTGASGGAGGGPVSTAPSSGASPSTCNPPSNGSTGGIQGACGPLSVHSAIAQVDGSVIEVMLASFAATCGADNALTCEPDPTFKIRFQLPATAKAGDVFSLADLNGYGDESYLFGPDQPGKCLANGGMFHDGTVEVLSIDDTHLRVRLQGTSQTLNTLFQNPVDGEYDAQRCTTAATPHLLTSGIIQSSDASTLYVYLSTNAMCPEGDTCGAPVERVFIPLPAQPTLHYPMPFYGYLHRFDPSSPAQNCLVGDGLAPYNGAIEVLAYDGQTITVKLSYTPDFGAPHGNADGTFTATTCATP